MCYRGNFLVNAIIWSSSPPSPSSWSSSPPSLTSLSSWTACWQVGPEDPHGQWQVDPLHGAPPHLIMMMIMTMIMMTMMMMTMKITMLIMIVTDWQVDSLHGAPPHLIMMIEVPWWWWQWWLWQSWSCFVFDDDEDYADDQTNDDNHDHLCWQPVAHSLIRIDATESSTRSSFWPFTFEIMMMLMRRRMRTVKFYGNNDDKPAA